MKAKRFFAAIMIVCLVAGLAVSVSAAERKIGHLAALNMTPEQFTKFHNDHAAQGKIKLFTAGEPYSVTHVFYDSLTSMQMALNAGEIDEMSLPEAVADYMMNINDGYEVASIVRTQPSSLALGFRKDDDPTLRNKFNEALLSMKLDGTLAILIDKYVAEAGVDEPEHVIFEKYENIDTNIKVAVTGDLPPLDFMAADGHPAGFNTAVLNELAKRMKVNITLVDIDSSARAAAIASKRVDVVFWFEFRKGVDVQPDIPDGIVLSQPYYHWNEILNLKKK